LNNDIKAWTDYSWQLRLTHVYDTSAECKTAENLLGLMLKEKAYIESELGQRLIGWVSDASGESHATHKQLQNRFPQLLVVNCYAHQVGLILAVLRLSLFLIWHCRCS